MKKITLYLAVLAAIGGATAYLLTDYQPELNAPSAVEKNSTTSPEIVEAAQDSVPEPTREGLVPTVSDADSPLPYPVRPGEHPLSVFKNAAVEHPARVDPMIVFGIEDFSDEQIVAYNDLHVIPFNKVMTTTCESTYDETLAQVYPENSGTSCNRERERQLLPYSDLDKDALAALAETDATAANVMAMQATGDDDDRGRWYLRAAALSGKSGPILEFANRRFSSVSTYETNEAGEYVEVLMAGALESRAVLETIAARMGDPRANPELWRNRVLDEIGEKAIEKVDERSKLAMGYMAEIQQSITGSTQMLEVLDA